LGRGQRTAFAIVAAVIVVNLSLSLLEGVVGGTPGGPTSSSFSTGSKGARAWADLLADDHHPVRRLRTDLASAELDPADTVVLADPGHLGDPQRSAVARFVAAGGRLVVVGTGSEQLVGATVGYVPESRFVEGSVRRWLTVPEVARARNLRGAGSAWEPGGPMVPVAGDAVGAPVVAVADAGRGRVVAVSDAALFWNENLSLADNAALALDVVGPRSRPVVFVESVHGYGATGFAAIPPSWKWGLAFLALAGVAAIWSGGTRFGVPEPDVRVLRPPRRDHVEAIAADLEVAQATDADLAAPLLAAIPPSWHVPDAASADLSVAADLAVQHQRAAHGLPPRPATDTVPSSQHSEGTTP
jgi:hypothetical protein